MSQVFEHKGFVYELIENQGFYHCLVYDRTRKKVLYRTKYFGSEERARSKALSFIQDYIAHQQAELLKAREEARRKEQKKRKKAEKKAASRRPKPKKEDRKKQGFEKKEVPRPSKPVVEDWEPEEQIYEPMSTESFYTSLYPSDQVSHSYDPTVPQGERTERKETSKTAPRRRSDKLVNTIILVSAFLLIVTGIIYAYSEQFASDRIQVQDALENISQGTVAPVIKLPEQIPTLEPTLAVTLTPTGTITTTVTAEGTPESTDPPPTP